MGCYGADEDEAGHKGAVSGWRCIIVPQENPEAAIDDCAN
jgi:hypothetical protein